MNADAMSPRPRPRQASVGPHIGQSTEVIRTLKERDNTTNWKYLARIYAVIALTIAGALWVDQAAMVGAIDWWWAITTTLVAIVVIGASQHQFGGAIHEGTHYMLFANRRLNELASDWLAAFPIYTSTYHFRLHHLAHHQFINDPERDPDFAQLQDSGHWLDFPITHVDILWALLRQLWLPNLFRYTITRARYSALGTVHNPYRDPDRAGSPWPVRLGILFAVGMPTVLVPLVIAGSWWAAFLALSVSWGAVVAYYAMIPAKRFPSTRLEPVISHRATAIGRVTYLALLYGAVSGMQLAGWGPAWVYFALLWLLPLFTTFPLFMILRQWVQHGNADRGRYTNTRVFLVGPLVRYAVFPFGMDYHLPHHMMAAVPHYRLRELHELLLQDREYRDKGVIVEGYFGNREELNRHPTAVEVLGEKYAPKRREAAYVDNATLEYAEVANPQAISLEVAASLRKDTHRIA